MKRRLTRKARDGYRGKFCHGCETRLTLKSFGLKPERPDGLRTRCKDCENNYRSQNELKGKKARLRYEIASGRHKVGGGHKSGWESRLKEFRETGQYHRPGWGAAQERIKKLVLVGGKLKERKIDLAERRRKRTEKWKRW